MHNKRIITMSCLIILILCLFCACNGSNKTSDVTDKPEISQSAGSDETLTGLPTGSPTEIPTETPTTYRDTYSHSGSGYQIRYTGKSG